MSGTYEIYRCSTLGDALADALDELVNEQQLTPALAMRVLVQFDKSMYTLLAQGLRNRGNIKGSLKSYRFCDDVWTFDIRNGVIQQDGENMFFKKARIIASKKSESQ